MGQGCWECLQVGGAHTRDTGEKDVRRSTPVSAWFLFPELRTIFKFITKLIWGQSVAWLGFDGITQSVNCCNIGRSLFGPALHPHFYTRVAG